MAYWLRMYIRNGTHFLEREEMLVFNFNIWGLILEYEWICSIWMCKYRFVEEIVKCGWRRHRNDSKVLLRSWKGNSFSRRKINDLKVTFNNNIHQNYLLPLLFLFMFLIDIVIMGFILLRSANYNLLQKIKSE